MRCRHCRGNLVLEPAHGRTPAELKCLHCGREPDPATLPREVRALLARDGGAPAKVRERELG